MRELKERLTEIDRVEFPEELWSTALRRAAGEAAREPITRSPFRPTGRIAATTVAFAVFIVAAFFLWNAFESRSERPRLGQTTPAPDPLSQLPVGWNELPDPPDVRAGSAAAWTGSKLLVWGGYVYTGFSDEDPLDDGYSLDPLTGSAETLPTAPLAARASPAVAWTGSELIVWGGWDLHDGFFGDGAAYDPSSGEWRGLPQAPIEARMPFSVWTGSELLVWGSKWRDTRLVDGAAYDPAADSWRRIADAPLELTDGTAVWTGKEMIVFGAALHGGNEAGSPAAIGAAYDPATDSWRLLADSQLSPQASTAAWNGERIIAWDYLNKSQTYDPDRDEWGPAERVPLQSGECWPQSVSVSGSVLGEYCGQTTIYSDGGWSNISRRKYIGWGFELVAADPAVLLLGSNVDTGANVLLAYRVPTDVGSTSEPSPIGPKVQVASGKLSGRSWTLQAFLTEEGLCMALDSALSCGPSRSGLARPKSPILVVFTNTSHESEQEFDGTWLYGVVSPEVAELELVTEGGVAIPVSIVEKDIGLSVRFYVVALERAPSGGALIARGADGSVLREHEVHLP